MYIDLLLAPRFTCNSTQNSTGNHLNIRAARALYLRNAALLCLRHRFHRQCSYGGATSGSPHLSTVKLGCHLPRSTCVVRLSHRSHLCRRLFVFFCLPSSRWSHLLFRRHALCHFRLAYRFLFVYAHCPHHWRICVSLPPHSMCRVRFPNLSTAFSLRQCRTSVADLASARSLIEARIALIECTLCVVAQCAFLRHKLRLALRGGVRDRVIFFSLSKRPQLFCLYSV